MSNNKEARPPSALKNFIAGGAGGIALVITGQPLDTIKVKILFEISFIHTFNFFGKYSPVSSI